MDERGHLREEAIFAPTSPLCEVIMPLVRSHYTNAMDKLDGQFAFVWVETDPIGNGPHAVDGGKGSHRHLPLVHVLGR